MSQALRTGLQLRSLVKANGELEITLRPETLAAPGADEVIVQMLATPLNPSDLGLLFGPADLSTLRQKESDSGSPSEPAVVASIPPAAMKAMAARVDVALPVGNEGAGRVVEAGSSAAAQALMGKLVAAFGGGMYTQLRCLQAAQCVVLPDGITAAQGASIFVNPLTALSMVDAMHREGHSGLVHTAAASNLGQMLNKLCLKDGIPLVNIVRNEAQAQLLRDLGATHVCNSSADNFTDDLTEQLTETGATLAFDAIGGGNLVSQILAGMEVAANRNAKTYSRYGSTKLKQAYLYGTLDMGPTVLKRNFGTAYAIGGWLLPLYLEKIGKEAAQVLQQRVLAELTTTFASHYAKEISLAEALDPQAIAIYGKRTTGEKFLINPSK